MMDKPNHLFSAFVSSFLRDASIPRADVCFRALAGDGSNRCFWRIFPSNREWSYIAMENPPVDAFSTKENLAYLKIGEHLFGKGLGVAEIYRWDLDHGWFIMKDFGDWSLQDKVTQDGFAFTLYERVIEQLYRLQIEGSEGFDPSWCCQTQRYDPWVMRHYESDYFRDAFLAIYLGMDRDWSNLDAPFDYLARMASQGEGNFFLHRDFQSRNIMVSDHGIGILDWQGGRLGPLGYDLASILIDPYTALSIHERDRLYEFYLKMLKAQHPQWVDGFQRSFPYLAIQRNLQILGAFAYLSKVRKKRYFEAYVPIAVRSIRDLLYQLRDPGLATLTNLVHSLPELSP